MSDLAIVVLAAGMGKRMKSEVPKVLHRAAGHSLLAHVLTAVRAVSPAKVVVVHGPGHEAVKSEAQKVIPDVLFAEQAVRLGTGHAVLMAEALLSDFAGKVLVLYGDAPLVQPQSLTGLIEKMNGQNGMAVLGFIAANPFGYGRLITEGKNVIAIREQKDASEEERLINLCNSGIIAIDSQTLWPILHKLKPTNAQGELYLTDIVELMRAEGNSCALSICDEADVAGVNDRLQLAGIEAEFQRRLRKNAMLNGATLVDPATVYFASDTRLGKDVVIEPNVFFGPGVSVGDNVQILANCHIEGAAIASGARIGPFARLRPGSEIGENAHVGNYVEVKKATLGKGAKVNHLSYVGDAYVGAGTNIGAGTITCNYDGFEKHKTEIGENVFVGSNTALVAPVRIGDGVNIAAGSVVGENVPDDALAIARPPLVVKDGWAKRYRAIRQSRKMQKTQD